MPATISMLWVQFFFLSVVRTTSLDWCWDANRIEIPIPRVAKNSKGATILFELELIFSSFFFSLQWCCLPFITHSAVIPQKSLKTAYPWTYWVLPWVFLPLICPEFITLSGARPFGETFTCQLLVGFLSSLLWLSLFQVLGMKKMRKRGLDCLRFGPFMVLFQPFIG